MNVQEIVFQYPYDPLFDTLAGIEDALAPGERFPLTTREYARLTRYHDAETSLLVLELEDGEQADLSRDLVDYIPEFSGITQITTPDFKTKFYTLGQRKGIGVAGPEPLYVVGTEPATNTLVVGTAAELGRDRLLAARVNWVADTPTPGPLRAQVKIRYKAAPAWADAPSSPSSTRALSRSVCRRPRNQVPVFESPL